MSSRFPLEIYFRFIDEVSCNFDGSRDAATLSSCSQVCLAWADFSQKALFRCIDLGQARSGSIRYPSLMAQIKLPTTRGSVLGGCIRELEVAIGPSSSPQYGLRQDQFALFLSHCPQLRKLTLRSSIAKFDATTMVQLRRVASEIGSCDMRTLCINKSAPHSSIIYQLLSVWPTIQRLYIGCRISPHETPSFPTTVELRELVLDCGERLPQKLLEWLLSRSQTSLELLELHDEPGPLMKYIVSERAPHIRSLSLPCFNRSSVELVRLCHGLEKLRMVFYQKTVLLHLHDLPASIRHLAFQNLTQNFPHISFLKILCNLPDLKDVTYHQRMAADKLVTLQEAYRLQHVPLYVDGAPLLQVSVPRYSSYVWCLMLAVELGSMVDTGRSSSPHVFL